MNQIVKDAVSTIREPNKARNALVLELEQLQIEAAALEEKRSRKETELLEAMGGEEAWEGSTERRFGEIIVKRGDYSFSRMTVRRLPDSAN